MIRLWLRLEPALLAKGRRIFMVLGLVLWFATAPAAFASSAIFGGGPFYSAGTATMNALRSSGYTTVMLWTLHVYADSAGSLIYNDQLVVANGVYVGNASWPAQLATLKTAPTSVKRIEWSVGSWGANDFLAIKTLMDTYGTNTDSILYRNFLALKNATGADAIDFDDETQYDVATAVKFGRMLSSMGYKVTLCPYTNPSFWQSVYNQLGTGIVDAVYLQCYAGGVGNNPSTWNGYFSGLKVQPGMWCMNGSGCSSGSTASQVQAQMVSWVSSAGIPGGFMWLYDDMLSCNNGGSPADYAMAINTAINRMTPPVVTETNLSLTSGSFAPLATNDLILGNAGKFAALNYFEAMGGWTPTNLTDGDLKAPGSVGNGSGVYSIITSGTVTYDLGGGVNGTGYTITGIRSLTSWSGSGRVNPNYSVNYSLDGVIFYPVATVNYLAPSGSQGTDVALGVSGLTNVVSLQFTFPNSQQNGGVTYTELAVFGASSSGDPNRPLVTLAPVSGFNTLNIAISANGSVPYDLGFPIGTVNIPINSTDSETAQLGGTQMLALEALFNSQNQGTVTGVAFTDGNIQVMNTLNWHLGLGSYLGFAIGNVYVTGSNIVSQVSTPHPMSVISGGTTFPLADQELILDGGNLAGYATGRAASAINPFNIDLAATPLKGPVANTGTGSVTLSSPAVAGNIVSYTVTAALPVNFSYLLQTNPVDVTVAITGTTRWQGTLTRLLPSMTPTQTILRSSLNPSSSETNVTFTATVQAGGVTAGDAASNIVFQVDGTAVFTNAVESGSGSYTNSMLTVGTHTITAVYRGDANYAASTTTLTQSIYLPPVVTETDLSLTNGSFAPLSANDLLLGNAGVSTLTTVSYTGTATNLTDGVLQAPGSPGTSCQIVMIQTGTVTYSLGHAVDGAGYNLTGIRSLTAWSNGTRINPKYTVSYSWDGTNYLPLATVNYSAPTSAKGTDVSLGITGLTNVVSLQFNFPNNQQNSGVAYSELAAFGTATSVLPPSLSAQLRPPGLTNLVLNLSGLQPGQSYTLQSVTSLAPAAWSNVLTFVASQANAAFTNATSTNTRQFYRLKY